LQAILTNTAVKVVGTNSPDTFKKLAPNMGVKVDELLKIPKYNFYIKSGDSKPYLFKSSDLLLTDKSYVLTKEERERLHEDILNESGVYKPIGEAPPVKKKAKDKDDDNNEQDPPEREDNLPKPKYDL